MDVRGTYMRAATAARNLIAQAQVGERWGEPSAIRHMTVGEVAAHLGRAITTAEQYLRAPAVADGDLVDAVGYYLAFGDEIGHDVDTDLNRAVRDRSQIGAANGHEALLGEIDLALRRLADDLEGAPIDFVIEVLGGLRIRLDDYLVTRIVELAVHIDDLAVSIDVDRPDVDERAMRVAIASLVDMARRKHGDIAVLRALARRERDSGAVIPVL